jgi:2-polyprenyl-3-methyl-5-hydroxy-6-metoxy-1,4-benzoquinol methylase
LNGNLDQRSLVPELMDDPALDASQHRQALRGLRRINLLSGTVSRIGKSIIRLAPTSQPIQILDIGSGGGDVTIGLAKYLQSRRVKASLLGWDMSSIAVQHAMDNAKAQGCGDLVSFQVMDAIEGLSNAEPQFDFIVCSLFLHHLNEVDALRLLQGMRQQASIGVIIDDLNRTRTGYWLAKLGCHVLSRSPIVHFDGPQSVRAAFSVSEMFDLATRANILNARIVRSWLQRFTFVWSANNDRSTATTR